MKKILSFFQDNVDGLCQEFLRAYVKGCSTTLSSRGYPLDWRQYALYIVLRDHERSIGLEEKPLRLYKSLEKGDQKPTFMLRYIASPEPESSAASLAELNSQSNPDQNNPISQALIAQNSAEPEVPNDASPPAPSVEIFKPFRVGREDPSYNVLPAALRKYNIQADWRVYSLYVAYGDEERLIELEEFPLAIFKVLDRQGKNPMFTLR
jgi:hypothetical protein